MFESCRSSTPATLSFNIRAGKEVVEEKSVEKSTKKKGYVNFVGVIVDKDGKAVKGATVRLLTGDDNASTDKMTEVQSIESEAKGRFEAAQHSQLVTTLLGTLTDSASPEAQFVMYPKADGWGLQAVVR